MIAKQKTRPSSGAVKERLAHLIHEIAGIPLSQIVENATIDEDLRMESVAFVELQVAVEDEYGVELDPIQILELNEFSAIAEYVYGLVAAAQ